MKSFYIHLVPNLARNLTGEGSSPQLVDISRLISKLWEFNPGRWLQQRIIQRPRVKLAVGGRSSCPLTATTAANLTCWVKRFIGLGYPFWVTFLLSHPVQAAPVITQVNTGGYHTCALTSTGGVKCWGYNTNGQLGDGTTSGRYTPVDVSGLTSNVIAISKGDSEHTCAIMNDNTIKCWGQNNFGQVGDGTTINKTTPVLVPGLTGVTAVATGGLFTCILNSSGGVKCWGRDDSGQLGNDASYTDQPTPVDVSGLTSGVIAIATASSHACALLTGGNVKCWGYNGYGQVQNGGGNWIPTPSNWATSGIQAIALGLNVTCVLTSINGTQCRGLNSWGQLGDGTTTNSSVLVNVGGGLTSGVAAISVGDYHACALTSGGAVKCWGKGTNGDLGDGLATNSSTPVNVSSLLSGVTAITAGSAYSSCALMTGGNLKCWGWNSYGELGDNTSTQRNTPVDVVWLPEIEVQGNAVVINDGDTTPSTSDDTDFGSVNVGNNLTKTFTIKNTGEGDLNLTGSPLVNVTGSGVSVTTQPTIPIAALTGSTTFQVKFQPTGTGLVTGSISMANNDSNENPYNFSIRGTGVNTAPVANDGTLTTNEDTAGSGTLSATDAEGNSLTYSIVTNGSTGSATITDASTGAYTYTPNLNQNGTDTFTFKANDGTVDSTSATVTVTITPVNDVPVASNGTLTTNEDTAGSGTLTASDLDANPLTYSIVTNGTKGTATITNASTGAYSYTPTLNQNGTDTFTFKANDGTVDSNIATVTVTITAVNDSPTLTIFSAPLDTTAEDTEVELIFAELTTQGDESDSADAINSGTVTSFIVQAVSTGTLKIGTAVGTATAYAAGTNETIDATHQAYWTPALNANGTLNAFTVKAKDDSGALSSTAVQTQVIVTAVNDAPVITGQNPLSTNEDTALILTLTDEIVTDLDNAYPTGFTLTVQAGSNYTVSGTTITPAANFNGTLTVPVKVNDGGLDSNIYNLTVTVVPVNDAPIITGQNPLSTNEDTALTLTLTNEIVTDIDNTYPTGFTLTVQTGSNYTVSGTTITPVANFNGTLTVPVKVNDGGLDSNLYNLTVTVNAVNDVPVATAGTLTTLEDTVGNGTVTGTDVEGSTLTYYLVTDGSQGTAAINSTTGVYTYTPTANLNGSDSFTFKVNDGAADSTPATVTVTITPVNDIPTFSASDPPAVLENTGTHTLTGWATFNPGPNDPDNVLAYTVSNVSNPGLFAVSPSVDSSGTLTYTLATNQSGLSTFDVTVQDTGGTANGGVDTSVTTTFTLTTNAPELNVRQGNTVQANGSTYDFGAVLITQTSPVITFTIENLGISDLSLTGTPKLALTGDAAVDFKVVDQTTNTMVPGGHSTFTVTFIPTVMGPRRATLTLLNNDSDETIDTLVLQGQGLTPNVKVSQGAAEIPMGGSFDLGVVGIDHLVTYPFTIENVGNSDLRLTGGTPLSLSGMSASEFNVDTTATQSVLKAGEKTEFLLNLIPVAVGTKTVKLSLPNDDLEQGNYSFTVTAQGTVSKYLQVTLAGNGHGTVTSQLSNMNCLGNLCQQPVIDSPQWVYLKALPDTGSTFLGWSGDPACQAAGKVFVMADTACVATFELQSYELTVSRVGQGHVTGPGFDCPPDCTETVLYGTEVQLEAVADREWIHTGWKGRCDQTGQVQVTNAYLCQAVFEPDLQGPNLGDGNGDGVADALQDNVISLPDKVSGNYLTFAVQPATCAISDIYTDLPENYGNSGKPQKPMPQGLIYFELACPQAQISLYNHALTQMRRNLIFQKYGPTVPGDDTTADWYRLPNVTFEAVTVGGNPVVKATYTLQDGQLGDSTGVDGRIVDPGGMMFK